MELIKMKHQQEFETKLKQIQDNLTNAKNPTAEQKKDLITVKQFLKHFQKNVEKQNAITLGIAIGKTEFNQVLSKLRLHAFRMWE